MGASTVDPIIAAQPPATQASARAEAEHSQPSPTDSAASTDASEEKTDHSLPAVAPMLDHSGVVPSKTESPSIWGTRIQRPPSHVLVFVHFLARWIAKKGLNFEKRVLEHYGNNVRLSFLHISNPYHAYYQHRIYKLAATAVPLLAPTGVDQAHQELIRMTGWFVAEQGRWFVLALAEREFGNKQYDFLNPKHKLFNYFQSLVIAYSKLMRPDEEMPSHIKDNPDTDKTRVMMRYRNSLEWERLEKTKQLADTNTDISMSDTVELVEDEYQRGGRADIFEDKGELLVIDDDERTIVSPITGKSIPISKIEQHLRKSLIDPNYEEEKGRIIAKIKNVIAPDDTICQSILAVARTNPYIYGQKDEICNAVKEEFLKERPYCASLMSAEQFIAQHPGPSSVMISVPFVSGSEHLQGQLMAISVPSLLETVRALKERIGLDLKVDIKLQKLSVRKDCYLMDDLSLAHYNIGPDVAIDLTLKKRQRRPGRKNKS